MTQLEVLRWAPRNPWAAARIAWSAIEAAAVFEEFASEVAKAASEARWRGKTEVN